MLRHWNQYYFIILVHLDINRVVNSIKDLTQHLFIMHISGLSVTQRCRTLARIWFVQFMERNLGRTQLSLSSSCIASFMMTQSVKKIDQILLIYEKRKHLPEGMNVKYDFRLWVSHRESVLCFHSVACTTKGSQASASVTTTRRH